MTSSQTNLLRPSKTKSGLILSLFCASSLLLASCSTLTGQAKAPSSPQSSGDAIVDLQAQAFSNVQMWGKAYEADGNSVINIIGYAKALSSIGSDTRAIKILGEGTIKHPNDAGIIRTHAKILSKKGLVGPALRKMQLAQKLAPNDWRIFNDIGELHSKMNEQSMAIASFKRALQLEPGHPNIHTNMGVTYMFNKQLTLAVKHLTIAVNHPNATPKMRQNLAFALGLQGKYDAARKMFLQDLPIAKVNANIAQLKALNAKK